MRFWKPDRRTADIEAGNAPEGPFQRLESRTEDRQSSYLRPGVDAEDAESRQGSHFSNIELTEITDVEPNKVSISTFEDDDDVKQRRVDRALHSKPVATILRWFAQCSCFRSKG